MHNSISKKLLAGALSVMMVLSLVAPTNSQAASKYTLTNKTSVKAGVTYKYQLKGVKTSQYVKVTRNVSGETVKYNKKSVTKNTKIKGTGKTLKLFVNYGEKAKNYTGKVTVKIYNKKTNKVVKTIVEKATVKCSEDVAGNITISDISGLQSDGTGLVEDTITLSYGDEVGTPASITWYRDNAILATFTDKAMSYSATNGLAITKGAGAANYTGKVGKYWAVVKTTAGKTIKSNTIELTDVEAPAVIKSFAIEDDYETGVTKSTGATKLDYNKTDKQAIATLVVNRDYAADLSIYTESNKTFTGSSSSAVKETDKGTTAAGFTSEASNKKMTNEDVSTATTTTAKKYVADNGEVTYRWVVNGTGLTRGTSYVAVYDQDSIKEDTIGDGKENVSKAATAPYLTAPAKIAVTKASAGSAPEISLYDEAGNVLAWLGNNTSVSTIFTGLNVYENKSKSTTAAHSAGVTNASTALKGVITGNHVLTAAGTYGWYYATATTTKGIFADKAVTLTSDFVSGAEKAADSVTLAQNSTTATTAEVSFTNAKTDGIVYILTAQKYNAITKDSEVATNAIAHANVTKGDAKVLVEGALDAVGDYYAVFMPTDATAYNRTDSAKAEIKAEATTLKMDNANLFVDLTSKVLTVKGLIAYDQYGAKMSRADGPYTASATVIDVDGTTQESVTKSIYNVDANGVITLEVTFSGANVDKADGVKVSMLGSEVTATARAAVTGNGPNLFKVKVDGAEATHTALTATLKGDETINNAAASATTDTATFTINDQYGAPIVGDSTATDLTATTTTTTAFDGCALTKVEYAIAANGTCTVTVTGTTLTSGAAGVAEFTIGGKTLTYTMANNEGTIAFK